METPILIFLFLALALGSFAPSWYTGSLHKKLGIRIPYLLAVSAVFNVVFFAAGYFSAVFFAGKLTFNAGIAGAAVILITGLKLILESVRFSPEEKIVLVDDAKTVFLVSLSRGFNYFFAGLGTGLCIVVPGSGFAMIFGFEVLAVVSGLFSGQRFGLKPQIRSLFLISGVGVAAVALRSVFLLF